MKFNNLPKPIAIFSFIEIAIGTLTIVSISISLFNGFNTKPINVLIFVYTTSLLSCLLGIGISCGSKQAYELLLFLAGVVVISKLLIFCDIIQLNGALETAIPSTLKNTVSVVYHCALWYYLRQKHVRSYFQQKLLRFMPK